VEPDPGLEDDGPFFAWLPPEDRLWRHPSEVPAARPGGGLHGAASLAPAGHAWVSSRGSTKTWSIALVAGIVGALAASGIGMAIGSFDHQTTVIRSVYPSSPVTLAYTGDGASINWSAIDDALAPSVVAITVTGASGPATGSGTLLMGASHEAYVVTDSSLIASATATGSIGSIAVAFLSGQQVQGHLVGQDPLSGLAVLSVPDVQQTFPALGSVAQLHVADQVMAIGAPGAPGGSVLTGTVTAENSTVDMSDGSSMDNLIAVSPAPVPPTLAGGPLVNQFGEVVGITVSVDPTDSIDQGLTFAVPVDEAEHVAQQMLADETVTHPWLGLYDSTDLSSAVARAKGIAGGALAGAVVPGSPASRAGIEPDDIITSLNGHAVTSAGSLTAVLSACEPGRATPISFIHDGEPTTTEVVIRNQPATG
jgi:putative serine protease PepD